MNKVSEFFYQKSNWITALLITGVTFGYLFIIFIERSRCFELESGLKSLGTSFGFKLAEVEQFLSARTPEMINCYIEFLNKWDNLFAILYGLMYTIWISFLFKNNLFRFKWINLFPLTQSVFDFFENFKLSQISNMFLLNDVVEQSNVQMASMFTRLKWACSAITLMLLIAGLVLLISKKIRASSKV
jgi:hypothetical protein